MRLERLGPFESVATRWMNNPHTNCWLQFIRGAKSVRSRYMLWHDADLFIVQKDFVEKLFAGSVEGGFACLGVSKAWDEWYEKNGLSHIVATWELMMEVNWIRRYKPWQHRGHNGRIDGKRHQFDITFLPQCLTSPREVGRLDGDFGFVHFNYVICTYRRFQNCVARFEDEGFKLLLVRLLIDVFDDSDWPYEVPTLDELFLGLSRGSSRVTYLEGRTKDNYGEFRGKLERLITSGFLGDRRSEFLRERILPFDEVLKWNGSSAH